MFEMLNNYIVYGKSVFQDLQCQQLV